ncbi:hypothetical protein BKA69DRAFT_1167791 [Paraphysoderma sedebokerense]|nr:hypothetical protein BKA69DRAFT_1167791 [Paraphysoderma sedebokerense]
MSFSTASQLLLSFVTKAYERFITSGLFIVLSSITFSALDGLASEQIGKVDTSDTLAPLNLPDCTKESNPYCRPVIYFAPNDPYHLEVMKTVARDNDLIFDEDIVPFDTMENLMKQYYAHNRKLQKHRFHARYGALLQSHTVSIYAYTLPSVLFTTFKDRNAPVSLSEAAGAFSAGPVTSYTIIDPQNLQGFYREAMPRIRKLSTLGLQLRIDSAIIAVRKAILSRDAQKIPQTAFKLNVATFPAVSNSSDDISKVESASSIEQQQQPGRKRYASVATSAIMIAGYLPMIFLLIRFLSHDKHDGLLAPLRKLSLIESAYWTSIFAIIVVLSLCAAAFSLVFSQAVSSSFSTVNNLSPSLLFVIQFLFGVSVTTFSCLAVAAINTPYTSMVLSSLVMAFSVLFPFIMSLISLQDSEGSRKIHAGWWYSVYADGVKSTIFSFLPVFHYGRLMGEITAATSINPSFKYAFNNLTVIDGPFITPPPDPRVQYSPPPAINSIYWLLGTTVGWLILCWYLNQVFVGRSGGAKPFYFFVKNILGVRRKGLSHELKGMMDESRNRESVIISKLRKHYGKFEAVRGIDLTLRKGRCLALLGHNGSGKSSLINVLSGLLQPTSGDGFVFGHRITEDMSAIQSTLGSCPQHDLLWQELTPYEHLRLYSRFKGIAFSVLDKYIKEKLDKVGLRSHGNQLVGTFSGGMKRRLSIVACSVGSPKLIVMDEPTTALDPINRRKVWDFIKDLKQNAVLLLTTHNMEEADALGDEVCIIDHGEVKAVGTSLELKNRFGTGYQITLLTAAGQCPRMANLVKTLLPEAEHVAVTTTSLTIAVPKSSMPLLGPFFKFVQSKGAIPHPHIHEMTPEMDPSIIREWGVQNCSLEQVFLKLCGDIVEKETKGATLNAELTAEHSAAVAVSGDGADSDEEQVANSFRADPRLSTQVFGVVAKNWAENQFCPFPDIRGLHGWSATSTWNADKGSGMCDNGHMDMPEAPKIRLTGSGFPVSEKADGITCQFDSNIRFASAIAKTCNPATPWMCIVPDYVVPRQVSWYQQSGANAWVQDSTSKFSDIARNQTAASFIQNVTAFSSAMKDSELPVSFASLRSVDVNSSTIVRRIRFKSDFKSDSTIVQSVINNQRKNAANAADASNACPKNSIFTYSSAKAVRVANVSEAEAQLNLDFPDYGVTINSASADSQLKFEANLHYYGNTYRYPNIRYFFPAPQPAKESCVVMEVNPTTRFNSTPINSLPPSNQSSHPLNAFEDSSAEFAKRSTFYMDSIITKLVSSLTNSYARQFLGPNERIYSSVVSVSNLQYPNMAELMAILFLLFSLLFYFPVFVMIPFMERQDSLYGYYRVNGLTVMSYWLGNYLFNMLMTLPILITCVIVTKLFFSNTNILLFFVTILLGIHSIVGLAFLFSALVRSLFLARLLSFCLPVIISILSTIMANLDVFGGAASDDFGSLLFPPIALAYSIRTVLQNSELDNLVLPLILLAVVGCVCIVLAVALNLLSERFDSLQEKVKSWLRNTKSSRTGSNEGKPQKSQSGDIELGAVTLSDYVDEDVIEERKKVIGTKPEELAVSVRGLNRWFGDFKAVDDLYLGLEKGECFGLLGPNGAGKSTTISILQGSLKPSSGAVTVGGLDVTDSKLCTLIGVCPQHDRVFLELTVQENLLFFARVRGASGKIAHQLAHQAAQMVGLTGEFFTRNAQFLSGGMRRRLSLAISLIGSPMCIFLDEPTTGLDPANRLHMWKIIGNIRDRKEHSICLISHSMDEVDTLSNRIGITAAGSLRCIGSQIRLKNKFGDGYSLLLQMKLSSRSANPTDILRIEENQINCLSDFVYNSISSSARLDYNLSYEQIESRLRTGEIIVDDTTQSAEWTISVRYKLPNDVSLGDLLEELERSLSQLGVAEWGLNQSTLEDVFIKLDLIMLYNVLHKQIILRRYYLAGRGLGSLETGMLRAENYNTPLWNIFA